MSNKRNSCYLLVVFLYMSGSLISPASAKDQQAVGSPRQELETALDQGLEVPAEIEEFVNALGCKCVQLKCHCISEHETNLSTTLEKLLTFLHHRTVIQKKPKPLRQEFKPKNKNGKQQPSLRVETFARALGCECVASRCRCFSEEEPDSSSALNDLMAYLDHMSADILEEDAMFQESVASRMRRFFRDGFRRLAETFTRRPR